MNGGDLACIRLLLELRARISNLPAGNVGQPEPALAAGRIRQAVMGVIRAAAPDADCSLPSPVHLEGPPS